MRLKKFLLVTAFCCSALLTANAGYKGVVVTLMSGETTEIGLDHPVQAFFEEGEMMFKSEGIDISIPCADLKEFRFLEDELGVGKVKSDFDVNFTSRGISISNLPVGSEISVYTLSGIEILSAKGSGEYLIPAETLSRGVYLLKVNNVSYKVNIK